MYTCNPLEYVLFVFLGVILWSLSKEFCTTDINNYWNASSSCIYNMVSCRHWFHWTNITYFIIWKQVHPSVMWNVCACVGVVSCVTCMSAWVCVWASHQLMHIITDLLMQFSHFILHCCYFFRYILTLSDYFSKWVEAVATPSKEAHQVASALYKVCII